MNTKLLPIAASGVLAVTGFVGSAGMGAIALTSQLLLDAPPVSAQPVDEQTNIRVYRQASPAVVSINTGRGTGSGSIISPDGLVLTNAHVIGNSRRPITLTLSDGRQVPADIVAFGDNGLDLAVLRIRGARNLPTLRLARPGSVQVGQRAFAIGNPFGRFAGTFTVGIVSRIDRQRGLIQTDAAITPGNSGGPLLNSQGELIGVNTAIFTNGSTPGNIGIGFAINIDRVQPFLTAVRQGRAPRVAQTQPQRSSVVPQQSQRLVLNGSPISGSLGRGDNVLPADNSFFDFYTFEGRAGQRVAIEMISQEIDPYLILLAPDGRELAQVGDGRGGGNARIAAILPQNGTYMLLANSREPGETGAYLLRAVASSVGRRLQLR